MNKRELVKKALVQIRINLIIRERFLEEGDFDMYGFEHSVINAKVSLLFEMGLLTKNQYERLFDIVNG